MITIDELKGLATQAQSAGQLETALKILWRLVDVTPAEIEPRLKLADALAQLGASDAAAPVYVATATHAAKAGHPLVAVLIGKILETQSVEPSPAAEHGTWRGPDR